MEIKMLDINGVSGFSLDGKLDVKASEEVDDYILPRLLEGAPTIIDMTNCGYVSSSGLRTLMIIAKKTAEGGGGMGLVNVSDMVWEVMEMTGFDSIFERFASIDEAVINIKAGEK